MCVCVCVCVHSGEAEPLKFDHKVAFVHLQRQLNTSQVLQNRQYAIWGSFSTENTAHVLFVI